MTPSFETLRAAMIDSQLRPTGVNDMRVIEAFMPVPRETFVPLAQRGLAYVDAEIAIGGGRVVMEPMLFGNLVMAAELEPADRVLLIGAASGYEAAVIARLAARVIAVEEDGALASAARVALGQVGAMNVDVVAGPLAAGWVQGAPYDVVFLNGAAEVLPPALIDQLAEGGRFVGVIREAGGVAHASAGRKGGGVLGLREFLDAGGAPLPGFDRPRGFRF
jgi:protein-L-isoaspartate(D-aspartate) O-methyltransferase